MKADINLDRPLEWLKNTASPDAYGQEKETWVTHKWVWGMLSPRRGYETYEANQEVGIGNLNFVVRWDEDWKLVDRIAFEGEQLEIVSIQEFKSSKYVPNTREHYIEIICESRDSENTGHG